MNSLSIVIVKGILQHISTESPSIVIVLWVWLPKKRIWHAYLYWEIVDSNLTHEGLRADAFSQKTFQLCDSVMQVQNNNLYSL